MARIVGMNNQYIKVQMKNGTFEVYSKDCIDWEPELGQELGFIVDEDGNVFIDLKENIPAGEEYIPDSEKVAPPKKSAPKARRAMFDEEDEEEEEPVRKKKKASFDLDEDEEEEEAPRRRFGRAKRQEETEPEAPLDEDDEDAAFYDEEDNKPFYDSVAFLVMGILFGAVALVAAVFIAKLKIVAMIAGAIAAVLGIIGFLKSSKKPLALVAVVLGVLAIVLSLLLHGDGKSVVNTPTPTPEVQETAPPTPTPVVAQYETDKITSAFYNDWSGVTFADAVVAVKNTGTEPVYFVSGKISVVDNEGNTVKEESDLVMCTNIIKPGEVGYVQARSGSISLDDWYDSETLEIKADLKLELTSDPVFYTAGDSSYSVDGSGYPYIIGNITNDSGEADSNVTVQVMFFDGTGAPIGVTEGVIDSLGAGESAYFEVYGSDLPHGLLGNGIAEYEVYACKKAK